ncbi:hypothetical protein CRYUN_Cryun14cG0070200 [Craigia yunnanensis]
MKLPHQMFPKSDVQPPVETPLPKLTDPDNPNIPCVVGNQLIMNALCDTRAAVNVIALALYEIIDLPALQSIPIRIIVGNQECMKVKDEPVSVKGLCALKDFEWLTYL